jgi:hypothetical protein
MNTNDQQLAHNIKIKFGTAPGEPNEIQLSRIKDDLKRIVAQGRKPSSSEWSQIVAKHCPGAGKYSYAGADNSDLVTLLQMATNPSSKWGKKVSIETFKKALEQYCDIQWWKPSNDKLHQIASEISLQSTRSQVFTKNSLQAIISKYAGGATFLLTEGVDFSDLKTLLLLAKREATSSDGK